MSLSKAPFLQPLPNYWYAAVRSRELKCKPISWQLLEQPIVIFRQDDGSVAALLDRCAHRNAPLSKGQVVRGNCIQCPYHGWSFDRQGKCQMIPGLCPTKEHNTPSREVPWFAAKESDGLIWIYGAANSQPTNPPNPQPYFHDPRYASFTMKATAQATLLDAIENLLDATHTHFVHSGLIRKERARRQVRCIIRRSTDRVEAEYLDEGKQSGIISKIFGSDQDVGIGRFILPSIAQLEYRDSKGVKLILTANYAPLKEKLCQVLITVTYRRVPFIPSWLASAILKPFLWLGLKQDRDILLLQSSNKDKFKQPCYAFSEADLLLPHINRLIAQAHAGTVHTTVHEQQHLIWL